jgi:hypothetical protein
MVRISSRRGGTALIEFCLLGIPVIFVTFSIVSVSLNMWVLHNLAFATSATARYVSLHGYDCSVTPNSCTLKLGDIAKYYAAQALAQDPSLANVTFTDGSGATSCSPVNSCNSSTAQFPAAGYNMIGQDVTVKATYTLRDPIAMYWPPDKDVPHNYTVGATSRQRISF